MLRVQSQYSDEGEKEIFKLKIPLGLTRSTAVGLCLTETGSCFVEILVSSETSKCELDISALCFQTGTGTVDCLFAGATAKRAAQLQRLQCAIRPKASMNLNVINCLTYVI